MNEEEETNGFICTVPDQANKTIILCIGGEYAIDRPDPTNGLYYVETIKCGSDNISIPESLKNKTIELNTDNYEFGKNPEVQIIDYDANQTTFQLNFDNNTGWSENYPIKDIKIYNEKGESAIDSMKEKCEWNFELYILICTLPTDKIPSSKNGKRYAIKAENYCNQIVDPKLSLIVKGSENESNKGVDNNNFTVNDNNNAKTNDDGSDNDNDNDNINKNEIENKNNNETSENSENKISYTKLDTWKLLVALFVFLM